VSAVLTVGASVIVGGDSTAVTDTSGRSYPAARLAKYLPATGTFDLTWAPSTTGPVYALASSGDRLLVGGNFSKLDGRSHASLGAVSLSTGDLDPTFTTTVDKQIDTVAIGWRPRPHVGAGDDGAGSLAAADPRRFQGLRRRRFRQHERFELRRQADAALGR